MNAFPKYFMLQSPQAEPIPLPEYGGDSGHRAEFFFRLNAKVIRVLA